MKWLPRGARVAVLGPLLAVMTPAIAVIASGCDPVGTVVGLYDSGLDTNPSGDSAFPPFDSGAPTEQDTGATAPSDASPDSSDAAPDAPTDGQSPDTSLDGPSDAAPDAPIDTSTTLDTSAPDSMLEDTSAPPIDSGITDTAVLDTSLVTIVDSGSSDSGSTDATLGLDSASPMDATLRDSGAPGDSRAIDTGSDTGSTVANSITCTTTRQAVTSNGCVAVVTVEHDVGLYPVAWPGLGWAGALGTDSSGISQLYTNNSVANPKQQFLYATDTTLALYVGYTDIPGDGGPNDWGTAHRTEDDITSFTLNVTKTGTLPANCTVPEISVQCSGSTTLGCQWYGGACGSTTSCCPDSIYTTPGDAGPWPVACTQNLCCNGSGAQCNTGVACCSGVCRSDGGSGVCK